MKINKLIIIGIVFVLIALVVIATQSEFPEDVWISGTLNLSDSSVPLKFQDSNFATCTLKTSSGDVVCGSDNTGGGLTPGDNFNASYGNVSKQLLLGYVTGSSQCLQVDTNGIISGSGAGCGGAGGGHEVAWGNAVVNISMLDNDTILRVGNISLLFKDFLKNNTNANLSKLTIGGNPSSIVTDDALTVFGNITFNFSSDDSMLIDGIGRAIDTGVFRFIQLPLITNTRIMTFLVDMNSQPDTQGIVIDYTMTGLADGEMGTGFLISADTADSTGGMFEAMTVLHVGEENGNVLALGVGPTVDVIVQHSGSDVDIDTVLINDTSLASGSQIIVGTGNFSSSGVHPIENLSIFENNEDYVYIGHTSQFGEMSWILNTLASGAGVKPTFEYSAGSGTWTTFTPTEGTNGFRNNGVQIWVPDQLTGWTTETVNGTTATWIRIQRTQTGLATVPIEGKVQVSVTTDYSWDKNADVFINNLKLDGNLNYTGENFSIQGGTAKFELIANPDSAQNFAVLSLWDDVTGNPLIRVHSAGTGRATHFLRSVMISRTVGHLCSKDTDMVDCDTDGSGNDLIVLDDIWYGGAGFFSNGTFNISDEGNLVSSGTANFTELLVINSPAECTGNKRMTYTNMTTSICVETDPTASDDWNFANNDTLVLDNGSIIRTINLTKTSALVIQNITVIDTNFTMGNIRFFQYNSTCDGWRRLTTGGIRLSCDNS